MIEIKNRWTGEVIYRSETADTLREAVFEAIGKKISLRESNLSGSNLSYSNLRGSDLRYSNLSYSNLSGSDLRDSDLSGSNLSGSDLRDSDLSGSNLSYSNLRGSDLRDSDLRDSDLRDSDLRDSNTSPPDVAKEQETARAKHPTVPVVENLDAKILERISGGCALDMSQWHTCETTHCRAGWAITLAGERGVELERRVGPFVAGRLIYLVST